MRNSSLVRSTVIGIVLVLCGPAFAGSTSVHTPAADRISIGDAAFLATLIAPPKAAMSHRGTLIDDDCIADGQACVLHGTPCCGTDTCKGKFPNTTCQ